jgi:hypothetical protein
MELFTIKYTLSVSIIFRPFLEISTHQQNFDLIYERSINAIFTLEKYKFRYAYKNTHFAKTLN